MVTSIGLSSVQIFAGNLNGAAGNDTGGKVRAMLARCSGPIGMKKCPDSMKLFERDKQNIQLKSDDFCNRR